jgi:hypothetical protein
LHPGRADLHGLPWPNSFTGRAFWENAVGRLYRAGAAGVVYVVDAAGNLDGSYTDMGLLGLRVAELIGSVPARKPTGG